MACCNNITGNIETMLANHPGKGLLEFCLAFLYFYPQNVGGYFDTSIRSTNISGNINIFSDKYDLSYTLIERYTYINGQLKDLKNLKKIWYVDFAWCNVTGSKTDLYNNGANIRYFDV